MPILRVELLAGRPLQIKEALAEKLTEAVVETLQVSPERVRVLLHEVEGEHWYVAGRPLGAPHNATTSKEDTESGREE